MRPQIPEPDHSVCPHGNDVLAVFGDRHLFNPPLVTSQHLRTLLAAAVPQLDLTVYAFGDQTTVTRKESDVMNLRTVPTQSQYLPSGGQIPELDQVVPTSGSQLSSDRSRKQRR